MKHTDNMGANAAHSGAPMLFLGWQGDYIISGRANWPSFSYWLIPGTELED